MRAKGVAGIMEKIGGKMAGIGLKMSASSSPAETLPGDQNSSGNILSQNANPISDIAYVT